MPARSLENLTARYGGHRSDPQKKAGPGHGPRGPHGMATGKPQNAGAVVRRILSYIGMFKKRLIAVFGCILVSTAASIAGSYLLRPIINHIAEAGIPVGERIAYLMMMIGVMGGVYLAAVAAHISPEPSDDRRFAERNRAHSRRPFHEAPDAADSLF